MDPLVFPTLWYAGSVVMSMAAMPLSYCENATDAIMTSIEMDPKPWIEYYDLQPDAYLGFSTTCSTERLHRSDLE